MPTFVNKSRQLADCFKLLAVFFYEPEKDMWEQEGILSRFSEGMNEIAPDAYPAANRMCQAFADIDEEQMKVDYAALFVGPFELLAAPYGSVYLEREKRIMGDSTMAVLNLYQEAGLMIDVKDAPDHIAIELEFIHYLYSIEGNAVQNGDRQKEIHTEHLRVHFLNTCLIPWVYQFCQSIQTGTENLFYVNLAECLQVVIAKVSESDSKLTTKQSLIPKEHAYQPPV